MKRSLLFLALLLVLPIAQAHAQTVLPAVLPARTTPQLTLQIGHVAQVTALAVSPDKKTFASASSDGTAKL